MAIEAERLIVTVEARGGDAAAREIDEVGDSALDSAMDVETYGSALDSAASDSLQLAGTLEAMRNRLDGVEDEFGAVSRSAQSASGGLTAYAGASGSAASASITLNQALDETDDELDEVRDSAVAASGAMNGFAGSSLGAAIAGYSVHDALVAGAIPAIVTFGSMLGPLAVGIGGVATALVALAGGFGTVIGAGFLAWADQVEDLSGRLEQLRKEIEAIIIPFGQQFIPLIEDAIAALPELVRRIVEATGDMQPFVDELRRLGRAAMDVIPQMTAWFMDFGREVLPIWRRFTDWVGRKVPDALVFFRDILERSGDEMLSFTLTFLDALAVFTDFGATVWTVVGPALEVLLEGFADLLRWVQDLPQPFRDLTIAAGALAPVLFLGAVAAAELAKILGGVFSILAGNAVIEAAGISFGALAGTLAVVAAAAVAAYYAFKTNFAGIRDAVLTVADAIQQNFGPIVQRVFGAVKQRLAELAPAWDRFATRAEAAIARVVNILEGVLLAAIETTASTVTQLLDRMGKWWSQHGQDVRQTVQETYGTLETIARAGLRLVLTATETILGKVREYWTTHGEEIRSTARQVYTTVRTVVTEALGAIVSSVQQILSRIVEAWDTNGQTILENTRLLFSLLGEIYTSSLENLRFLIEQATDAVLQIWNAHGEEVIATVTRTIDLVIQIVSRLVEIFAPIVTRALELTLAAWNRWGDEVMTAVRFTIDGVIGIITTGVDVIVTAFRMMMTLVNGVLEAGLLVLEGRWRDALTALIDALTEFGSLALDLFKRTFNRIIAFSKNWGSRFVSWAGDVVDGVIQWFQELYQRLIGGSIIPEMFSAILTAARDFGSQLLTVLADAIKQIIQRFVTFKEDLVATIREAWANVLSLTRTQLAEIQSAIESAMDTIQSAIESAWDTIQSTIESVMETIESVVESGWDAILSAIESALDSIVSAVETQMEDARDTVETKIQEARDKAEEILNGLLDWITGSWDIAGALRSAFSDAGSAAASGFKSAFNAAIPSSVSIPSATVAGKTIGGGSMSLPQLDTGGYIKQDGLAMLHAGERVLPESQVDRGGMPKIGLEDVPGGAGGTTSTQYVDIEVGVTIEGDADRNTVESGVNDGLSSALRAHGISD